MVFSRRSEYGFNGYQVPVIPRAARSARKRGSPKKKVEEYSMYAFNLLATVAGKLLVGKHRSTSSINLSNIQDQCPITGGNIKEEIQGPAKQLEMQSYDQGASDMSCLSLKLGSSDDHPDNSFKEDNKNSVGFADILAYPDSSGWVASDKLGKYEIGYFAEKEVDSAEYVKSSNYKLEEEAEKKNVVALLNDSNAPQEGADMYSLEDQVVWDAKPLVQGRVGVALESKDDDENSSGCTHGSTTKKSFKPAPCMGGRTTGKVLASKYWKVATKWKEKPFPRSDVDLKTDSSDKRSLHKCQRSQLKFPFKKRKLFYLNCGLNSDGEISGDSSDRKVPLAVGQHSSYQPANPNVRFRIKSFRVPELFIEIPETATVGSLKRMIMEAVSTILGGESRVGIVLQGRKVRDDSKTLVQTGICHGNNELDALGFTLEPNSSQGLHFATPTAEPSLLCQSTPRRHSRYPHPLTEICKGTSNEHRDANNFGNSAESDHGSATSPTDQSMMGTEDTNALMPVSGLKRETLAVVPVCQKSKHSGIAQRRVRRPFSVAEVEALVQAVEKLGTGRWRDVKLRAFESVKHRTYVDLKLLDLRKRKGRNDEINAGQMEDTGTHSKNLPAAKEGRAGASGAAGQSPNFPCLLVPRTSQATAQTPSSPPPAPIPDSSPPLNRFPGRVRRGLNLIHTYIQGRYSFKCLIM